MNRSHSFWTPALLTCGLAVGALAFSACRQPVEQVQPPTITDVSSYFWTSSSPRTLFDTSGKLTNTLSFSGSGSSLAVQDNSITLQCQTLKDSVKASGFTTGSVIDLDYYSFFSAQDTQVSIPVRISAAVLVTGGYYAATDHGIWSHTSIWQQDNASISTINLFAYDATAKMLYAATLSGQVMQKSLATGSGTWSTLPVSPGPLNAMIVYKGSLYVAQAGGIGVSLWSTASQTWYPLTPSIGDEVTALFPYTGSYPILVGTVHGNVYMMSPSAGLSPAAPALNCNSRINCFLAFNGGVAAGTNIGLYKSPHGSDAWTLINATAPIRSIAQRVGKYNGSGKSDPDSLCFISSGGIFWVDTSGNPVPATAIRTGLPALGFVFESGTVNSTVVTELSLCVRGAMTYGNWISPTTDSIPSQHPESPGGLLLLRSDRTNDNDSWRAGTLVTHKNWQSYAITGRIREHLDSLHITNGSVTKSYPDVLVVRYAHELAGAIPQSDAIPYWVVYYAKGTGPVMFDKQEGGKLTRRQLQYP